MLSRVEKVEKKEVNMLSGSIMKGLLRISVPIMIMNVAMMLFNIVDMTILRIFDTGDGFAVGAVGACGTLITLITGLLIGCSAGSNVVIAKYIGMNKPDKVERATGVSLLFSFVGGLVLGIIGICFAKVFLSWTNCPAELMDGAALYFRLYFVGLPILMVYNFAAAILRATGNSRGPMIYLIVGSAVKLAANVLFVGIFKLAVAGVAYATLLSWVVMTYLALRALIKTRGATRLKLSRLRFYGSELKEVLRLGVPAGLQQGLYSIANVIIATTVNAFGAEASTGISIANNFDGVLYQIVTAAPLAVLPYVSQNIGAGNFSRARRAVLNGMIITIALGASFGALSAIFSSQLSSLMSSNPAVIAYSRQKMIIVSSTYFICGINNILGESLRGMGRPNFSAVTTLLYMCAFRFVWVYAIFPLVPNFTFLYLVWPIGWILSIITLLPFYFKTFRRLEATHLLKKNT